MTVQTKNFTEALAFCNIADPETKGVEVRGVEIHLQSACEWPDPFDAVQALAEFHAKTTVIDPDGAELPLGAFVKALRFDTDPDRCGNAPVELTLGFACRQSAARNEDVPNSIARKGYVYWVDAKLAADIERVATLAKTFFDTALHSQFDTHKVAENLEAIANDGLRHRFYDWDRPVTERTNIWPDEHGVGLAPYVTLRTALGEPLQLSQVPISQKAVKSV